MDIETFIERKMEASGFFGPLNGKYYAIRTKAVLLVKTF
jgi:hypothetical protein